MLSRSAERIYWTGRYLERVENTARIVQQYSQLLLDLPEEVGVSWTELVRIVGAAADFEATGLEDSRSEVQHFLLADARTPPSLMYSLRMARENIRNSRDLLPQESWEAVNELYQHMRERLPLATRGESLFDELAECIGRCQQLNGSLTNTMSHLAPFHFLMLGQAIERADMTSRIIDVAAAAYIADDERIVRRYGSTLWTNVLKSVSGFQMYRQYCQPHVDSLHVIDFLLCDRAFPRSIAFCSAAAAASADALPRNEATSNALAAVNSLLQPFSTANDLSVEAVSRLMDDLQLAFADVHNAVVDTWFLPGER